jgi:hypothetical protein
MAFRPPQRLQPLRQVSYTQPGPSEEPQSASSQQQRTLEDSQEWVLFSPISPSVKTETTSTERTTRTTTLSRFSEIGSLDTAGNLHQLPSEDVLSDIITEHEDDDAELDSLDDGLHAFHEPSDFGSPRARMIKSAESLLPTHDGMGTFGESSALQEHLKQFERAGRRRQRQASNPLRNLNALEEVEEVKDEDDERVRRIESWRLEQSRALLEEIERETRRMRQFSRVASSQSLLTQDMQTKSEYQFTESGLTTPVLEEESFITTIPEEVPLEDESWWKRITRRVIRDLIGIDEQMLSVIFGESLVEEEKIGIKFKGTAAETLIENPSWSNRVWQERLLERLARELGILVHQLSEHPGAFSTYLRTQEAIPYVGLTSATPSPQLEKSTITKEKQTNSVTSPLQLDSSQISSFHFPPTINRQVASHADPSLWGIEEESEVDSVEAIRLQQEKKYWEKELDVRMVYNFLKAKFSSSSSSANGVMNTDDTLPLPLASNDMSIRRASVANNRAALIRQHHPLASNASVRRRDRALNAGITRRHSSLRTHTHNSASSCASQSSKRSVRSSNSRNFWEIPSTSGVGSAAATMSGMWGEVGGS